MVNALVGCLAAIGMVVFFELCTRFKICSVDIMKGLGSFFTQKEKNAYVWGLFLNLLLGIVFSFAYFLIFRIVPIPVGSNVDFIYAIAGVGLGFNHGMIAALVLAVIFPSFHPIEKYRKAGFEIAVVFAVSHVIYGAIVGLLFNMRL